mmetsp:Transcript_31550/g.74262  ORF Transcript_31550/g.74262 Transcript_31550/m.74262 type:complete len:308 (-) Transcript_31550:107-1030(-)
METNESPRSESTGTIRSSSVFAGPAAFDRIDDGVVLLAVALGDINWSPPPPCAKENLLLEDDDDDGVGFGFCGDGDISWSPPPPFAKENLLLEDEDGGGLDGVLISIGDGSEAFCGVSSIRNLGSESHASGSSLQENDSASDTGERKQFPGVNLFFLWLLFFPPLPPNNDDLGVVVRSEFTSLILTVTIAIDLICCGEESVVERTKTLSPTQTLSLLASVSWRVTTGVYFSVFVPVEEEEDGDDPFNNLTEMASDISSGLDVDTGVGDDFLFRTEDGVPRASAALLFVVSLEARLFFFFFGIFLSSC